MPVSVEELRERLSYDPETGVLRWRKGRRRIAGYRKKNGYREIECRYKRQSIYLLAHRVAWAIVMGAWPRDQIDHRNGNRDDNRLANLREATAAENQQNRARARGPIRQHTGLLGASKAPRCKDRWRAHMHGHYLGTFGSSEEAHQAYLAAKAKYHQFQPVPREE
jgi:hypothetical protein